MEDENSKEAVKVKDGMHSEGSAARVRAWTAEVGSHKRRANQTVKHEDSLPISVKEEESKNLLSSMIDIVVEETKESSLNGNRKPAGRSTSPHDRKVHKKEGDRKRDLLEKPSKTEKKMVSSGAAKEKKDDGRSGDRLSKKDKRENRDTEDQREKIKNKSAADYRGSKDKAEEHKVSRDKEERRYRAEKRKRTPEVEYKSRREFRTETKSKDRRRDLRREEHNGRFDRWELKSDDDALVKEQRKDSSPEVHRKSSSKASRWQSSPTRPAREKETKQRGKSRSVSPQPKKRRPSHSQKEYEKSPSLHHRDRLGREQAEKEKDQDKSEREREKDDRDRANNSVPFENRFRRFGGRGSGLGGYSPRRRRSDAAIKTPSPPPRSPDKDRRKSRAWDLPPPGVDSSMVAAIAAAHHAATQQAMVQQAAALASVSALAGVSGATTSASPLSAVSTMPALVPSVFQQVSPAVTAVSLTQATRPLRRLYIGNVPSTVSEGELLEFMNAAMLSANANHLPGTKPCISCSVHVDKSYAFAEFLTPEDATAAIAFDGITLHGTTLKIRRPKDFVHPIVFVGGISSSLSSDKVKEIVTAFGQLKAYHWEFDRSRHPPAAFAFLEYLDPSVTLKACAGLNGMRLGNDILTAVQATPNALSEEATAEAPFYGVPEHAKSLLEAPTCILEIENVVTEEELSTLRQEDVNEIMEDVRVECSRFGNVKSLYLLKSATEENLVTFNWTQSTKAQYIGELMTKGIEPFQDIDGRSVKTAEPSLKPVGDFVHSQLTSLLNGSPSFNQNVISTRNLESGLTNSTSETLIEGRWSSTATEGLNLQKRSQSSLSPKESYAEVTRVESPARTENEESSPSEKLINSEGHANPLPDIASKNEAKNMEVSLPSHLATHSSGRIASSKEYSRSSAEVAVKGEFPARIVKHEILSAEFESLHLGRVYVEFSREESACQAAHALHGRAYGDQNVFIRYFPLEIYHSKIWKKSAP
ncbi:hypothetical protein O6H91_08G079900 [Diphasiastrum complanatum]|uniref:Uncharacterized protein n=2 Tax=Diphasiastrum complanatum TaxID=34168 RepID=A0ACC2CZ86_DIPCM|nr:hypothetical protein O6H91_08G079900 [Diphasiastrum complanatum]KAJ7547319.1 hypothetical protein O6H91_08G079900 [Diphasiastrum complanatum]